jgi:phospholipid-transporting ATPase
MNAIRTTKYTVLTFLPKNLFEQFSKMANVYFLFIMVLQIIPPISITNGQPAILLPLLFVCAVSGIKDLFEDIKRHRADDMENNRQTLILDTKSG